MFIKNGMGSGDCAVNTCCKMDKKKVLFNLTLDVTEILEKSCIFSASSQGQFSVQGEVTN